MRLHDHERKQGPPCRSIHASMVSMRSFKEPSQVHRASPAGSPNPRLSAGRRKARRDVTASTGSEGMHLRYLGSMRVLYRGVLRFFSSRRRWSQAISTKRAATGMHRARTKYGHVSDIGTPRRQWRGPDLNRRFPGYEPGALPNLATPLGCSVAGFGTEPNKFATAEQGDDHRQLNGPFSQTPPRCRTLTTALGATTSIT